MGFGHAVYSSEDPRNAIIKVWAEKLSKLDGNTTLYEVSEEIEKVMDEEKGMFANTDFFMAIKKSVLANIPFSSSITFSISSETSYKVVLPSNLESFSAQTLIMAFLGSSEL